MSDFIFSNKCTLWKDGWHQYRLNDQSVELVPVESPSSIDDEKVSKFRSRYDPRCFDLPENRKIIQIDGRVLNHLFGERVFYILDDQQNLYRSIHNNDKFTVPELLSSDVTALKAFHFLTSDGRLFRIEANSIITELTAGKETRVRDADANFRGLLIIDNDYKVRRGGGLDLVQFDVDVPNFVKVARFSTDRMCFLGDDHSLWICTSMIPDIHKICDNVRDIRPFYDIHRIMFLDMEGTVHFINSQQIINAMPWGSGFSLRPSSISHSKRAYS